MDRMIYEGGPAALKKKRMRLNWKNGIKKKKWDHFSAAALGSGEHFLR